MPLIDEIKQQQENMKNKTSKERFDYFWYYHKTRIIVSIIVIFVGSILIHDFVTSKDTAFYVAFLNSFAQNPENDDAFIKEFAPLTDIDLDEYDIYLDTNMRFNKDNYDEMSMAAAEKFLTLAYAGEIDVVISEQDVFATYANNGTFTDLTNCLTKEQYEKYKEHFFYFDRSLLDAEINYEKFSEDGPAIPEDTIDRRNPSAMKDPVPVGIFLDDPMKNRMTEHGYYVEQQNIVLGFMNASDSLDNCRLFLDWVTDTEYTPN